MKSKLSKDILFTYFSGNAGVLQKQLVEEWLREPGSFELYYEWLEEWEKNQPHFLPDTEIAWIKNRKRIEGTVPDSREMNTGTPGLYRFRPTLFLYNTRKVVAGIALCGLILYFFSDSIFYRQYTTSYGELRKITLDDKSMVVLNSNSKFRVPRWGFSRRHRNVFLEGEAEFVVNKTLDRKKFIVHTPDNNTVTVLGTEFLVYTRKKKTRVVLNSGKVQLNSRVSGQPGLTLLPGQQASISEGKIEVEKLTNAALEASSAWKEHRLVFDRTLLSDVAVRLNEIFGVEVEVSDSLLAARQLTGTFTAEDLDEFLETLSDMLEIEITRKDDRVEFHEKKVR